MYKRFHTSTSTPAHPTIDTHHNYLARKCKDPLEFARIYIIFRRSNSKTGFRRLNDGAHACQNQAQTRESAPQALPKKQRTQMWMRHFQDHHPVAQMPSKARIPATHGVEQEKEEQQQCHVSVVGRIVVIWFDAYYYHASLGSCTVASADLPWRSLGRTMRSWQRTCETRSKH